VLLVVLFTVYANDVTRYSRALKLIYTPFAISGLFRGSILFIPMGDIHPYPPYPDAPGHSIQLVQDN